MKYILLSFLFALTANAFNVGGGFFKVSRKSTAIKKSSRTRSKNRPVARSARSKSSRRSATRLAGRSKITSVSEMPVDSLYESSSDEYQDEDFLPNVNEGLLRYVKCYQLITTRMPSDELIKKYLKDSYSLNDEEKNELAANNCVSLIETAQFSYGSSEGSYILADQSEQNIEIVQNFHRLHRSWFQNTNSYENFEPYGTLDVHENVEGALRYTKVLFGIEQNVELESVLKGNKSLEGIRSEGDFNPIADGFPFAGSPNYSFYYFNDNNESKRQSKVLMRQYTFSQDADSGKYELDADGETNIILPWIENPLSVEVYNPDSSALWNNITDNISSDIEDDSECNPSSDGFYLQYGKLLGVKEAEDCHLKYVNKRVDDDPWSYDNIEEKTMNLFLNPGGGALGGIDYWANNNTNITNNGQRVSIQHTSNEKFARRWARQVLSDFLCREVPVLNSIDSLSVNDVTQDSYADHTFRNDGSCMECHSTLDRFSSAVRNIASYDLGNGQAKNFEGENYYGIPSRLSAMLEYKYQNCYFDGLAEDLEGIDISHLEYYELPDYLLDKLSDKRGCSDIEGPCNLKTFFDLDSSGSYCFEGGKFDSCESTYTVIDVSDYTENQLKEILGPLSCAYDFMANNLLNNLITHYNKKIFHFANAETFPSDGDVNTIWPDGNEYDNYSRYWTYDKTPPKGALFMRDMNGELIKEEVTGISELAEALRDTPDFYACSVKRYFHFFTGSDVPLFYPDLNDAFNPVADMMQSDYLKLEKIRAIGNAYHDGELNLYDVFKEIILSDYFMESILGAENLGQVKMEVTDTKIDQYFNNFENCIVCHQGETEEYEEGGYPGWLYGYSTAKSGDCADKKLFLEKLADNDHWSSYNLPGYGAINSDFDSYPYVSPGEPCGSILYLVMSDSQESCENEESRHNGGSLSNWMSDKGIDQDLVEEMIYNIDLDGKFNSDVSDECEDSLEDK